MPMPVTLTPEKQEEMFSAARAAFKQAHAPYSNFRVGSAILTERSVLYSGCNVENASYGLTICAERNAIFAAVAAGHSPPRRCTGCSMASASAASVALPS